MSSEPVNELCSRNTRETRSQRRTVLVTSMPDSGNVANARVKACDSCRHHKVRAIEMAPGNGIGNITRINCTIAEMRCSGEVGRRLFSLPEDGSSMPIHDGSQATKPAHVSLLMQPGIIYVQGI
jgi:hypothetical protein